MTVRTATRATGRLWAYIGALLGGAVSVLANVAHSFVPPTDAPADWSPPAGAVAGATFWPVALFVAVEILARTPWPSGARWVALRYVGLLPVAFVAAVVSYRHLSGLLAFYNEDHITATLGPLAVDGLMVMATGALLATAPPVSRVPGRDMTGPAVPTVSACADSATAAMTVPEGSVMTPDPTSVMTPGASPVMTPVDAARNADRPRSSRRAARTGTSTQTGTRVRNGNAAADIARCRAEHPQWTAAQIATRIGVTERTVRRHLAPSTETRPNPAQTDVTSTDEGEEEAA